MKYIFLNLFFLYLSVGVLQSCKQNKVDEAPNLALANTSDENINVNSYNQVIGTQL